MAKLAEFSFSIVHRPGRSQWVSDALSRRDQDLPADRDDERLQAREQTILEPDARGNIRLRVQTAWVIDRPALRIQPVWVAHGDQDRGDPELSVEERGPEPNSPFGEPEITELWNRALEASRRYWLIRKAVLDGDRMFPKNWRLPIAISECSVNEQGQLLWRGRVWIPFYEPLRTRIIQQIHDSPLTGHPGREATLDLVSREYTWPGLAQDVRQFVRNCNTCGKAKVWREQRQTLLKPLPVPERCWQELSVDFIEKLPASGEYTAAMVVTDRLSKNVVIEPMKSTSTEEVARKLLSSVFRHHHLPRAMVSDRGTQFTSAIWRKVCEMLSIKRRLSTAFHPQTNGATERANQEIECYIRIFCTFEQSDWARLLPMAMIAYNNRKSNSTGMSAFFMTHGFHGEIIEQENHDRDPDRAPKSPIQVAEALVDKWTRATELARVTMAYTQQQQELQANRNRRAPPRLQVGDRVWLNLRNIQTVRQAKKFDWIALPYRVTEVLNALNYRLDTPRGVHNVFHIDMLRRAAEDPLPSQEVVDPEPPALMVGGTEEWEITDIEAHKRKGRGWQVLVRWVGWAEPTWEPLRNLRETSALERYEARHDVPWERGEQETAASGVIEPE